MFGSGIDPNPYEFHYRLIEDGKKTDVMIEVLDKDTVTLAKEGSHEREKIELKSLFREPVIVINVEEGANKPYSLNGKFYMRYGTNSQQLNRDEIRNFFINPGGLIGNLTIKDIYERSIPRNPLLFTLMERMELVEKAGSGLVRIEKAMRDYVLERPVIQADKNWFQITFKRPDLQEATFEDRISHKIKKKSPRKKNNIAPESAPVNAPVKLTGLQERILKAIQQETNVTYDQLAKTLRKDRSTIRRNIQKLKQLDIIKRIGPDKSGHWQIFL